MIYRLILPQHQIGMFNIPFFISSLAPSINQAGGKKKKNLIEVLKTQSQLNCNCRGF